MMVAHPHPYLNYNSRQLPTLTMARRLWNCAPLEAVINSKQLPKPAGMSVKDQQEFGVSVEKWVAGLAASKRNKVKKLLKRYACPFATHKNIRGKT